jgi:uncharacterized lipoprotein NlpE involved in copper resistance
MKKAILGTLVGAAMLAAPALSHADTYQYVNTMGTLESETADSVAQALALPTDKAADSGVILVTPTTGITTTVTTGTTNTNSGTTGTSMTAMTAPGTYTGAYYLPYSGTQMGTTTMATSTENDVSLMLNTGGTATLTPTYPDNASSTAMTETGTWMMESNGELQVTLTGNSTQMYTTPDVIVFSPNSAGTQLQVVQYNSSKYGSSAFMLTRSS